MSATLILHRLQQVDRQIDQAQARLAVIRKTLENDTELKDVLSRVDTTKAENQTAERELKQGELDVQSQQIKIQQTDASLYSGNVHNPKELQDLQNEVAALKRHLSTLEERELIAMQRIETTEVSLKQATTDLELIQAKRGNEHRKLIDEQTALSKDLERLSSERQATVSAIEGQILKMYDSLRQQKRGIAVAEVSDNSCTACGTTLTASLQQNARSVSHLANCPSCGRILYAG
jgi:predicted  nucleic acid-binding Zn-ribbon protein